MIGVPAIVEKYEKSKYDEIPDKVLRTIIKNTGALITEKLLEGHAISLPKKLGVLQIKGVKTKIRYDENGNPMNLSVDYKATKDLWKTCQECKDRKQVVFHLNEHTNGYKYKFYWTRNRVFCPQKDLYKFVPARAVKRNMAKLIKDGKTYETHHIPEPVKLAAFLEGLKDGTRTRYFTRGGKAPK